MNNKEENNTPRQKRKSKNKKPQNDINEEQILKYVQREFIRSYMSAYSQKKLVTKSLICL